ncbi:MAG: chromate efflux transporter [Candidatus Rokubacteria bacterium]|nr:chromate efflux transporter [Candidatus Rokubacteria bacterium]
MTTADPPAAAAAPRRPQAGRVREVAALSLKLGLIGFGGPAAHIALMEDEVVRRRGWVSREHFLDLLGATNLIPGPNSTEMAIHIGFVRAGWPGLIVGGACFILPAMLVVLAMAAGYQRYGHLPEATWLLYGVKPVIIAVIVQALWGLARQAMRTALTAGTAAAVVVLAVWGANEVALLFGAALLVPLARLATIRAAGLALGSGLGAATSAWAATALGAATAPAVSLVKLTLIFLKVGSILFGSGYVLLAFLRPDLVERTAWLSDRQLLDAIAVGQITPGPVLTTATFIGYVLAGVPGALLVTLGIFLPSFVFVALSNPIIPRLRRSRWAAGFLDGTNAAAVGLMAVVTSELGRAALVDWVTGALAAAATILLIVFRINSAWLVLGGAAVGLVASVSSP